jgi:hypothetical protein
MIRALLIFLFSVDGAHHPFKEGESVPVFVNKVGPYFNPHETYHYYSLPVCRPDEIKHRPLTLGEVLDGDRMAYSLYDIRFKKSEAKKTLCQVTLETEDIEKLKQAIRELYYFEFNIDNLRKFHYLKFRLNSTRISSEVKSAKRSFASKIKIYASHITRYFEQSFASRFFDISRAKSY